MNIMIVYNTFFQYFANIKENTDNMHRNDALPVKHDIQILFEEVIALFSSIVDVLPNEIVVDFFEEHLLQNTTRFLQEEIIVNNNEQINRYEENINILIIYLMATKSPNKINELLQQIFNFLHKIDTENNMMFETLIVNDTQDEELVELDLHIYELLKSSALAISKLMQYVQELPTEIERFIYSSLEILNDQIINNYEINYS